MATRLLLTVADRTTGTDEAYVHDLNGNRRMSGTTNWVVDPNNRLFRDGTYEYRYDKEGNRTERITLVSDNPTGATILYEYDHRNRLTKVTEKTLYSGGSTTRVVEYTYDAFDRLVKRAVQEYVAGQIDGHDSLIRRTSFASDDLPVNPRRPFFSA